MYQMIFTWLQSPTFHWGQEPRLQLVVAGGSLLLSHLPLPPLHFTVRSLCPFPQDTEHCRTIKNSYWLPSIWEERLPWLSYLYPNPNSHYLCGFSNGVHRVLGTNPKVKRFLVPLKVSAPRRMWVSLHKKKKDSRDLLQDGLLSISCSEWIYLTPVSNNPLGAWT